ncbi:MAG: Crp/Fnr family transcriptional regulator [Hyphomicrobiales bacterium]|nr:Crp/Fnr family transcriptional regulator [Hyphomicrobiales bacterium]
MIDIMSMKLLPLIEGLPRHELSFDIGACVFNVGDPIKSLYIVRSGAIHLVRHQENGSPLILQRARDGAVLAEASVYSSHYHCDARAESNAVAWAISRDGFRRRLSERPEFAEAWARHLAEEVQRARLHAEILSLKTVSARLSAWLAWNGALPAKGSWAIIAQEIGVSPEALYREISNHRKQD